MEFDEIGKYGLDSSSIKYYINKLKSNISIIAVTGEFSSGKTCFINALINKKDYLPHSNNECTPILIDLYKGNENEITIRYINGLEKHETLINENIKKYGVYEPNYDKNILSMSIPLKEIPWENDVHIIDTPGTNTIKKEHEDITNYIIKKADLILYVLNKVVSQSDINNILKIKKYTNNIAFIITHMDEIDGKTNKKYSKEKIENFVNEAKEQIATSTGKDLEEIIIYPIGSKEAFINNELIYDIRNFIDEFLKFNSYEVKKKQIIKQIGTLIQEHIIELKNEKKLVISNSNLEKDEIEKKYKKYINKKKLVDKEHNNLIKKLDVEIDESFKECNSFSQKLIFNENRIIIKEILDNIDWTPDNIENFINESNKKIGEEIRKKIEDRANLIIGNSYANMTSEIKTLINEFDNSIDIIINKPDLSTIEDNKFLVDIQKAQEELEEYKKYLEKLKCNEDENKIRIKAEIEKLEKQHTEYNKQINLLGEYYPQYDRVIEEIGESNGKVVGRVIGEIADIALLIWNPTKVANESKEAIKMADTVKDVIKSTQIIENMTNQTKAINESSKKISDIVKNVDNTRQKIKKEAKKNKSTSVTTILDMLSLGYWGEKIGGSIGAKIKPSKTLLIENEEYKKNYDITRNKLLAEKMAISDEINRLNNALRESDDIGKVIHIKKEIKEKEKKLTAKISYLEEEQKKFDEKMKQDNIKKYYDDLLKGIAKNQFEKCEKLISEVFDLLKIRLIQQITIDYENKVQEFDTIFSKLNNKKIMCDEEIKNLDLQIAELKRYPEYIEKWVI